MLEMLYMAHSGTRYLVLLAAAVALAAAVLNWGGRRTGRGERVTGGIFVGLLDLQVLLGVLLLLQYPWRAQLIGHLAMMLLAVAVAHGGSVLAKRREPEQPGAPVRAAAWGMALFLIVGGIMALGRGVFTSAPL